MYITFKLSNKGKVWYKITIPLHGLERFLESEQFLYPSEGCEWNWELE